MRKVRFLINNLLGRFRYSLARIRKFFQEECIPTKPQWRWAAMGVFSLIALFLIGMFLDFLGEYHVGIYLLAVIYFLGIPLMIGLGVRLGLWILGGVSKSYGWLFYAAVFFISFSFYFPTRGLIALIIFLLLAGSFLGGGIYNLTGGRWSALSRRGRTLSVFFTVLGTALFLIGAWYTLYPGKKPEEVRRWAEEIPNQPEHLNTVDPSAQGEYEVDSLTYGSGDDRRRSEYAGEAALITPRVDGSNFVDGWDKLSGKLRTFYWKVEPDALPLNGRVWFPQGEGPFPLVLMVHGNHADRDFSDPGYAYLGRHFASRGSIAVSVDQNFLNGAWSDFSSSLNTENDCRGWLLLKHLEQWGRWNRNDTCLFFGKVDLDRVVLIGHSRGGEAVSIASCFNQLPYYPDNAEEKFQFGFGIRGIAAIAPVDGQYYPAGIPTPVQNVNYFTIQGSMDADLRDYHGLRQMRRVEFTDEGFHFAAGLYVHGANHGQFNQSWGKFDIDYPSYLMLNRKAIIPAVDQEQIALVYLTAFVEESVNPGAGYVDLFKDYRRGKEWLPDVVFLNQYHESSSTILCDFEEDIDLLTGTFGISRLEAHNLASWYEARIPKKWGNHRNSGVFLGWNNEKDSVPGTFEIHLDSAAFKKKSGVRKPSPSLSRMRRSIPGIV